jgi:hypothetical protein
VTYCGPVRGENQIIKGTQDTGRTVQN